MNCTPEKRLPDFWLSQLYDHETALVNGVVAETSLKPRPRLPGLPVVGALTVGIGAAAEDEVTIGLVVAATDEVAGLVVLTGAADEEVTATFVELITPVTVDVT
jgi:hypothetical protein